ncbi:MAG: sugar phosphate isomerase/epimerase family protein [Chloroflexota bacterium]
MIRVSAFADEISSDLDEQLDALDKAGIHFLELRSVWDTNVLDLDDGQVIEVKQALDAYGVRVAAIGSPLGKVAIDLPIEEDLSRLDRAIELAGALQTSYIRIFSYYPPGGAGSRIDPATYRHEALARLREMARRVSPAGLTLLHENDADLYGDTIERCVDVLRSVDSPHLQAVLDPANFILCGQQPYPHGYRALRPWIKHVHVKDASAAHEVVPAGKGEGLWKDLLKNLRQDGYDGFFSLEPHLGAAGRFRGFSGPEAFAHAHAALEGLLDAMGWEHE